MGHPRGCAGGAGGAGGAGDAVRISAIEFAPFSEYHLLTPTRGSHPPEVWLAGTDGLILWMAGDGDATTSAVRC